MEPMCVVISECATSVICVCGIDRRERVCVFTTPSGRISMAAAIGEAAGIHKAVRIMKQARCASERAARAGAAY